MLFLVNQVFILDISLCGQTTCIWDGGCIFDTHEKKVVVKKNYSLLQLIMHIRDLARIINWWDPHHYPVCEAGDEDAGIEESCTLLKLNRCKDCKENGVLGPGASDQGKGRSLKARENEQVMVFLVGSCDIPLQRTFFQSCCVDKYRSLWISTLNFGSMSMVRSTCSQKLRWWRSQGLLVQADQGLGHWVHRVWQLYQVVSCLREILLRTINNLQALRGNGS